MRLPRERFDYSPITSRRPWTLPDGVPHRIKYFEAVYDYMRKKKGVWFTTGEAIYQWYKARR
jgi:hypothetical protein